MPKATPPLNRKPLACAISISVMLTMIGAVTSTPSFADQTQSSQTHTATQPVKHFAIPAGSLSQVLSQFAGAAGIAISFDAAEFSNRSSSGLQGNYSVEQGFAVLLAGTGQMAVRKANGDYVLQGNSATTLPAVTVSGRAMMSASTEETGSYTTYSMNTATRLGLSIRETPQSVSVVSRQLIDDMQLESLTDVVNTTTGLTSSQQDSQRHVFSARGFRIKNYQIDGVSTTWESGYSAGESQMDTILYDRIEVVRGASGLTSGAGDPSAAINLVRKKADSEEFTGHATIRSGSWDRYQGAVDVSTPLNKAGTVRARVVGSYLEEGSFVDFQENKKSVVYGTLAADLTDNTLFNIGISQQKNKPTSSTWGGLPVWFSNGERTDWSRSKTVGADWTRWDSEVTNYFVNLEHYFDSGASIYATYSKNINKADLPLVYLYGAPDRQTGLGMGAYPAWYDFEREQDNIDIYGNLPFALFGRDHEVTVGLMYNKQDLISKLRNALNVASVGNFYEWDGSYPEPEWSPQTTHVRKQTEQLGGYGVLRLSLADPLTLILGSRITNWDTEGMKSNGDFYEFNHHQIVTPYAGLIYNINDVYSAYVSYTDIFNPQDAQDRNGNYLDPLEGKNYEAGVKAEYFEGRLNAMLSVFRIEQDNLAQADVGYVIPGTTNQASYAAKGTTSKGFEAEISGAITDNWNLMFGWSQFQAEDADGSEINTAQPRRTATLFTTYKLNDLTLGSGVNWQSSNYTRVNNPLGQSEKIKQGSYALVRLMANYQMTPTLSAQLNINNLFDEKYYTNSGAWFGQLAYGAPRNFNLTLKYDF
ncbi:TonB-dependent siderophore receptor [Nitrincola sp. A-D6]|uniref:TonB-dependent siderophore receptor n=1 Tax=Nitrincola sp. A-D6 TaxID=1545442 RepID=UPI000AFF8DDD|nr:TonB-dependent receptor [Nitrincola sp. A-D6]